MGEHSGTASADRAFRWGVAGAPPLSQPFCSRACGRGRRTRTRRSPCSSAAVRCRTCWPRCRGERGGAPLHFLLAWLVNELGGGLTELRLFSALFAVASIPVVALLVRASRERGRARGLRRRGGELDAALPRRLCPHVQPLPLHERAVVPRPARGGRPGRHPALGALGLATVVIVAAHPYGALVVASQGLWVLATRTRLREAVPAFAVVGVVCIRSGYADLVLARRFDVGVGAAAPRRCTGRSTCSPTCRARAATSWRAGRSDRGGAFLLALAGLITLSRPTAAQRCWRCRCSRRRPSRSSRRRWARPQRRSRGTSSSRSRSSRCSSGSAWCGCGGSRCCSSPSRSPRCRGERWPGATGAPTALRGRVAARRGPGVRLCSRAAGGRRHVRRLLGAWERATVSHVVPPSDPVPRCTAP